MPHPFYIYVSMSHEHTKVCGFKLISTTARLIFDSHMMFLGNHNIADEIRQKLLDVAVSFSI